MWVREAPLAFLTAVLMSVGAEAQSCVPRDVPGPPLVQYDLNRLAGSVSLRSDGLVTESTRHVFLPAPDSISVIVNGRRVEIPDLATRGVVFCANSILAYPTGPATMRLLHVESGATHEFPVLMDSASVTQMSDGSLWYRKRSRAPADAGVQWHRLDANGGTEEVWTPPTLVLLDAWDEMTLLAEHTKNEDGSRVGRVVTRPPG